MLDLARGLKLDPDYVGGGTFALLAKKGAGKTYTARVMAEEMWAAGVPFVLMDPMGAAWGLRSSADGRAEGLPVAIFGGEHGDAPLERGAGEVIADLVVDEGLSMVLDMSALGSRAAEREFGRAFLERLYRRNSDLVHLLVDEADLFAPQKPQSGDQPLLGVTENIVRRGRNRGIGITLITQRPAVLNKDVLTQIDGLVAMRITSPQDRNAIDTWVAGHGDPEVAAELKASLADLDAGECWWWVPELDLLKRVRIRTSRTFDSSPTRKRGQKRRTPKTSADVDMGAIEAKMAATIGRAKAQDPRQLRAEIAKLRRELTQRPTEAIETTVEVPVEVPVLDDAHIERLEEAVETLSGAASKIIAAANDIYVGLAKARQKPAAEPPTRRAAPAPQRQVRRSETAAPADGEQSLAKAPRALLSTLIAHQPRRLSKAELSTLSGYKPRSSTYRNALSALRTGGYLDERGDLLAPSVAGLDRLGAEAPPAPQTTEQLLDVWYRALGKASREMLRALVDAHPDALTRDQLADRTGYSLTSSTYRNGVSALRTNGLLEDLADGDLRAADSLFITRAA